MLQVPQVRLDVNFHLLKTVKTTTTPKGESGFKGVQREGGGRGRPSPVLHQQFGQHRPHHGAVVHALQERSQLPGAVNVPCIVGKQHLGSASTSPFSSPSPRLRTDRWRRRAERRAAPPRRPPALVPPADRTWTPRPGRSRCSGPGSPPAAEAPPWNQERVGSDSPASVSAGSSRGTAPAAMKPWQCRTHWTVREGVGWKPRATSSLQDGQERRGGRRHSRQKTCWQGRTQGSENPSRQTGQVVPNLSPTNKIKTLAGGEINERG